jgi:outer membrane protein assembly factor BamB
MSRQLSTRTFLGGLLLVIAAASGCVGVRTGVSWADLSLVGEAQNILVAYNDRLLLVDPADGELVQLRDAEGRVRNDEDGRPLRWELNGDETGSQFFSAPIFVADDEVRAVDYSGRVFEINFDAARIDDPDFFDLEGQVLADQRLVDNVLLVPFMERDLVAYDRDTLAVLWRFETERGIWSQPLVMDDVVYFTSMDHHFYAADLETGEEIWRVDLTGALASTPLYDPESERFYVGSFNRRLFAVSMNGQIVDEYRSEDWIWSTPVLVDDVLYFTDLSGHVYALNAADFSQVWKVRPSEDGIRPSPLVAEDTVVVASRGGRIYWLDRETGATRTTGEENAPLVRAVGEEILSDILLIEPNETNELSEPLVIVSTVNNGRLLIAFTLENGVELWRYPR